ncbi:MAG: hypothetical protein GY833_06710 [Aestuariibacter sp.]|nr:hypothetical protein [Aestuariibacter sp.]
MTGSSAGTEGRTASGRTAQEQPDSVPATTDGSAANAVTAQEPERATWKRIHDEK